MAEAGGAVYRRGDSARHRQSDWASRLRGEKCAIATKRTFHSPDSMGLAYLPHQARGGARGSFWGGSPMAVPWSVWGREDALNGVYVTFLIDQSTDGRSRKASARRMVLLSFAHRCLKA